MAAAGETGHGGPITALTWGQGRIVSGGFDNRVLAWDPATLQPAGVLGHATAAISDVEVLPCCGPGGETLLSADQGGGVVRMDGAAAVPEARAVPAVPVSAVAAHPAGHLAIARRDGEATLARHENGRLGAPVRLALSGGRASLLDLVFLPDTADGSLRLAVARNDGMIEIWQVAPDAGGTTRLAARLPGNNYATLRLTALADDRLLSAGSDGRLVLWGTTRQTRLAEAQAHEAPITSVSVAPDGRHAVTGGANGAVTLWEIGTDSLNAHAMLGQVEAPLLAVLIDPARQRAIVGSRSGGLVALPFSGDGQPVQTADEVKLFVHPPAADSSPGALAFRACAACHTVTADGGHRAGPTLHRIFGRRAGMIDGYPYSEALRESGIVWNEQTIARLFELGPDEFIPGSHMPLQRLPNAAERTQLIDYLKKVTGS